MCAGFGLSGQHTARRQPTAAEKRGWIESEKAELQRRIELLNAQMKALDDAVEHSETGRLPRE